MFRFRLRTLLILLAVGPPMLGGAWIGYQRIAERYRKTEFDRLIDLIQATVKPETWDDADGGRGSDDEFTGSLSLIVIGGQTVHEQPANDE
jgi:hypothetical protein